MQYTILSTRCLTQRHGGARARHLIYQVPDSSWRTPKRQYIASGVLAVSLLFEAVSHAGHTGVHALFDLGTPTGGPFPSNVFPVPDSSQNTGRRVDLPLPDPSTNPSDYQDTKVLNTLDGFSMQPRLSIPFDGAIDLSSVKSDTLLLISLGDVLKPGEHRGEVVGINQIVWDIATRTVHVGSDAALAQHTRYALIITNGIQDRDGNPVVATPEFQHVRQSVYGAYNQELQEALHAAGRVGVREEDIVAASVFTTQSATAILEKIRDQIRVATLAPADFNLAADGSRTVFPLEQVTGITWNQQTTTTGPLSPVSLDLSVLQVVPGVVGQVAFGKYLSPDYELHPGEYIPTVGTSTGTPAVQGLNEIYFNLVLPSGSPPDHGWPVAIFGHGSGSNQYFALNVASKFAEHGIATMAINIVGHGFGPLGTLTVSQQGMADVALPAGGRGVDQNGDHVIDSNEGIEAISPRRLIHDRDGLRQSVADLMQLVRVIQVGMDVDGDGTPDLDPARIYFVGQSLGGHYGTQFVAVEPSIAAAVLNVPVGDQALRAVFSPVFRPTRGSWLAERVPSLLNSPGVTKISGVPFSGPYFNENLPLASSAAFSVGLEDGTNREIQSPVINDVPGAMAIQEVFKNAEWAMLPGDSLAYISHVSKEPLAGLAPKSILFQFDKADQNMPNPFSSALLRAGDLTNQATFYRHDLAYAENSTIPMNGHPFLTSVSNLAWRDVALGAQEQVATFFASDGKEIIHPEPQRFFEVPISPPLPEDLGYID
jgi:hypothetical protein